jgi:hypothetical protein
MGGGYCFPIELFSLGQALVYQDLSAGEKLADFNCRPALIKA